MGPLALEMSDCRESMEMQLQCFMCRLSSKAPCEPAQFLSPESRVLKPEASMAKSRCIMYAEIHGSTGQHKTGQGRIGRDRRGKDRTGQDMTGNQAGRQTAIHTPRLYIQTHTQTNTGMQTCMHT